MVATDSRMVPLDTPAPDFSLPDLTGKVTALADFADAPALLVAFMSNHCPYVQHVERKVAEVVARHETLATVAICANDAVSYPDDGPEGLRQQVSRASWTFPYLIDESQDVARQYNAACTPDFFLYDAQRKLAYRGAFDDSTPGNGKPLTGDRLDAAIARVVAGESVPEPHFPSCGCNIKWRE